MLRSLHPPKRPNALLKGIGSIHVSPLLTQQIRSLRLKPAADNGLPKVITVLDTAQANRDRLFCAASEVPSNRDDIIVFQQSGNHNIVLSSSRLRSEPEVHKLLNQNASKCVSSPSGLTKFVIRSSLFQPIQSSLVEQGNKVIVLMSNGGTSSDTEPYRLLHKAVPSGEETVKSISESQNSFTLVVGMKQGWYSAENEKTTGMVGLTWYDEVDGSVFVQRCRIKDVVSHVCSVTPTQVIIDNSLEEMFTSEYPVKPQHWTKIEFESFLSLRVYPLKFVPLQGRVEVKSSSLKVYGIDRDGWNEHTKDYSTSEKYALDCATRYLLSTSERVLPSLQLPEKYPDDWLTMLMDPATISSIGLDKSVTPQHSLPSIIRPLHHTVTAMGCRLLQNTASRPTRDVRLISTRQQLVSLFRKKEDTSHALRECLSKVGDIPVILNQIATTRPCFSNLTLLMDYLTAAIEALVLCRDGDIPKKQHLLPHSSISLIPKLESLRSILLSKLGDNEASVDDSVYMCDLPLLDDADFLSHLRAFEEHQKVFEGYANELQSTGLIRDVSFVQVKDDSHGLVIEGKLSPRVPVETLTAVLSSWTIISITKESVTLAREDLTESHQKSCKLYQIMVKQHHSVLRTLTRETLLFRQVLSALSKDLAHLDMLLSFALGSIGDSWSRPGLQFDRPLLSSSYGESGVSSSALSIPSSQYGGIAVTNHGALVRQISGDATQALELLSQCAQLTIYTHMGAFVPLKNFNTDVVSRLIYRGEAQGDTPELKPCTDQRSLVLSEHSFDGCTSMNNRVIYFENPCTIDEAAVDQGET